MESSKSIAQFKLSREWNGRNLQISAQLSIYSRYIGIVESAQHEFMLS